MNKKPMRKISFLAFAALLSGCAGTMQTEETASETTAVAPNATYEKALAEATAAVEKAASVGGEWRDIRWEKSKKKYLPSAIAAAEAGDYAKAMKLLEIVQFQAEAGYQQAMEQRSAGPRF